jgi:hypothetical protein
MLANVSIIGTQIANNTLTALQFANNTITSQQIANSTITGAQIANPLNNITLANTAISNIYETVNVAASAATGTMNYNILNQAVLYYTANASANWTLNFVGNSTTTLNTTLGVGQSATVAFLNTNGATAYFSNTANVDGVIQTIKWQGGSAPSGGNANSVDFYTYSIVKTAATPTYSVFASQTQFK